MTVLVGDPLAAFRMHADGMACSVAGLCDEDLFYGARSTETFELESKT